MPNLDVADQLSDVLRDAQSMPATSPKVAALQAVAKATQAAEDFRGVQEYQKVNTWVAANPFFRPSFVSGHQSAVIDSPPEAMGMLARTNPIAAWHAAEAVRLAAEDSLPGGDLYHHADGSRGPDVAQKFMSSASMPMPLLVLWKLRPWKRPREASRAYTSSFL
ncbi:unnamed protein product [Durusdinium trenchii]|uniref:Uncharacterized protein n=1 Tax=Durusdinium trenchii TaxID=1381693 RepID=A0ABP0PAY0_9DINO